MSTGGTLESALEYAGRGWPVFPCIPDGPQRKRPLTQHGLHDASIDRVIITAWLRKWPRALIGVPTGRVSGFVVLDVDVKHADRNGFDTLAELAFAILPQTPLVHTSSGGLHLYFDPAEREIRNTEGKRGRGIGPGLDWRGDGGYVIVPSSGSGYTWDPHVNLGTVPLAHVPERLLPIEKVRIVARPIRPTRGLSPDAEEALDRAARAIIGAPNGEQEATINGEAFAIGTLAGGGGLPSDFARRVLIWAARQVQSYNHRRPWRPRELDDKVNRAFDAGLHQPRAVRRAR